MCCHGAPQDSHEGSSHVRKPIGCVTGPSFIADGLNLLCEGEPDHVVLQGSNSPKAVQVHLEKLRMAIFRGFKSQQSADVLGSFNVC